MIGSILKLVTERPDLLADHLLAYSVLAKEQVESTKTRVLKRMVAAAVAIASGICFVILAGVALMLVTSLPDYSLWVLCGVPALMLVVMLASLFVAASDAPLSDKKTVVEQIQDDIREIRRLSELRP